jgi:hypothetical protein
MVVVVVGRVEESSSLSFLMGSGGGVGAGAGAGSGDFQKIGSILKKNIVFVSGQLP